MILVSYAFQRGKHNTKVVTKNIYVKKKNIQRATIKNIFTNKDKKSANNWVAYLNYKWDLLCFTKTSRIQFIALSGT